MIVVEWMLRLLLAYAIVGFLFGILFAFRGVQSVDPAAADTGVGFRLMILPGCAALWPLLLLQWLRVLR